MVRHGTVDLLGRIGEMLVTTGQATDSLRDALIDSLGDDSTKVRTNVIDELSDIRATLRETFSALVAVLSNHSRSVRDRAEAALIELGKNRIDTVVPLSVGVLTIEHSAVTRGYAVDVLGHSVRNWSSVRIRWAHCRLTTSGPARSGCECMAERC